MNYINILVHYFSFTQNNRLYLFTYRFNNLNCKFLNGSLLTIDISPSFLNCICFGVFLFLFFESLFAKCFLLSIFNRNLASSLRPSFYFGFVLLIANILISYFNRLLFCFPYCLPHHIIKHYYCFCKLLFNL